MIKECSTCVHANWARTAQGRLHPSGDGKCMYSVSVPLPLSANTWSYGETARRTHMVTITGGFISRRDPKQLNCMTYKEKL